MFLNNRSIVSPYLKGVEDYVLERNVTSFGQTTFRTPLSIHNDQCLGVGGLG